eukprot:TRINITY_DN2844_c0_g1_i1.p1 TRINITY_DN2844_c0_g1~~TRINITY_DN2844_c0_g1_i1.p1  ORF type:complete len:623 (+),score=96.25 TRINITY_DN2844_c0_g1_i1:692-2560(+)
MSGVSNSANDANYSIAQGCDDYLIKPLIRNVLRRKVDTLAENIIQKRLLKSERHLRNSYETRVKRNKEKIRTMAQQISKLTTLQEQARSLVETPISNIVHLIKKIENTAEVRDTPLASELQKLLTSLASTDLYRPSFQKLLDSQDCDSITHSQLMSAFMPRSPASSYRRRNQGLMRSVSASASAPLLQNNLNLGDVQSHLWGMNIWVYSFYEMEAIAAGMFESFDLISQFTIPRQNLMRFVHTVRQRYFYDNPYHNFQHAFSVMQSVFALLCEFELSKHLTNLDILSLLIASLCHDVEHPGVNNAFLIKTRSPLAVRYNDIGVLENHHASVCFQILHTPETELLGNLSEEDYRTVRKTIIDAILATDMEQHFALTTAFSSVLPNYADKCREQQTIQTAPPEIRTLIVQMVMKCSDISNIAVPPKVARHWFGRVADEFFAQGDAEKKRGKVPPPFMDREVSTTYKISADFSRFVGRPLFDNLQKFVPACSKIVDIIDHNLEILQKLQDGEEEAKIPDLYQDFEVHCDHLKVEDAVLPKKNNFDIRLTDFESPRNSPIQQNARPANRLLRGVSTPSRLSLEFDGGVFELDQELSPSIDRLSSGLGTSWADHDEFGTSIPSTPSV